VPERAYLSIGEVLALLKDEFADITISKIRFLESQGLIDPERTPSGYRKFYEPDVERLRWILRQQKEHYLPLRVIKGKLSEAPPGDDGADHPEADDDVENTEGPPSLAAVPDPPDEPQEANGNRPEGQEAAERDRSQPAAAASPEQGAGPAEPTGRRAVPPFPESLRRSARTSPAGFLTAPDQPQPLRPEASPAEPGAGLKRGVAAEPAAREAQGDDAEAVDEEIEMTAEELATASGLPVMAVAELERYGLVKGQPGPGGSYYDAAALEVALLAAAFARFGVEARHLKMWKTAADREADFYEQVVTPIRSQRSNKARRQAGDTVTELAGLGARLHAALVAGAMKRLT
jgi:DNA-binding transcriptional MerR regulator